MNRKGISPIISAVLLIAVSLSVVAVFSGWAPNLAQTVADSTSNSTLQTLNCDQAAISIESAFYNSTSSEVTVTLRNTDQTDLPNLIIAAFNSDDVIMNKKQGVNLSSGEVDDAVVSSVSSEPSYVRVFSKRCGSVEDRIDEISR